MHDLRHNRTSLAIAAAVLALAIAPGAARADDTCPVQLDEIKANLESLAGNVDSARSSVDKDFEGATSKDYASAYLDAFEKLNAAAKDATALVNSAYDLSGHTSPLAEGKVQTAAKAVTTSMSNAVELAQAALDDESTKLDVADIRCDQKTEDAALSYALDAMGGDAAGKYKSTKTKACKIVHLLADLQDKKEKLDDIRKNGYPLFYLHAKDKKKFAGKERTIQIKADLRLYPIYPDNVKNADGGDAHDQKVLLGQIKGIDLSYNSYFKWSDNNWTTLNLYQYIIGDTMRDDNDDYVCFPKIKLTSSVKVATCVKVKDIKEDSIKVAVAGKYWYNNDHGMVKIGDKTIPAPFGYLADVSDMKNDKMKQLQSKVADRLVDLLAKQSDIVEKARDFKESCGG